MGQINDNHHFNKKLTAMQESILAPLIPIIVSLGVFLMVFGIRYLQNKENMAMIAKGMEPVRESKKADPSKTLRNSLMFMGAGMGLLLALVFDSILQLDEDRSAGLYFALIAMFGGAGMLAAYLYERKNPPE
jgi:hypothetical protein